MMGLLIILLCIPVIYILTMGLLDVFLKNLGAWLIGIPLMCAIIIFAAAT
jgi:hypothetical protein